MVAFNPNASGSSGAASTDFASQLGGVVKSSAGNSGGDMSTFLTSAATGALSLVPGGAFFAPVVGLLGGLFGGPKTDEAAQSADINKIAAANGISGAQAGAVIANHANNSSDNFNDLAKHVANENPRRFDSLLAEYNQANPGSPIRVGGLREEAAQVAQQQQQMITTALTTQNFGSTATGQQLVLALRQLPGSQVVGTQNQTAGDIINAILAGLGSGAAKGAGDAAAETTMGKNFKWGYVKDWVKENQLLVVGLGIVTALGIVTVINIFRGKHGKITL